jgi:hypothetical protein
MPYITCFGHLVHKILFIVCRVEFLLTFLHGENFCASARNIERSNQNSSNTNNHFTMPGPKGSPRTAASILIANPDLTIKEAMTHAKYNKKASQCNWRQKNVSKKKNQILQASGKENVPVLVALNGADEATGTTSTTTREEDRRDNQESSNKSQKKQSLEQVAPI